MSTPRALVQFRDVEGRRRVAAIFADGARIVPGADTILALAQQALAQDSTLAGMVRRRSPGQRDRFGGRDVTGADRPSRYGAHDLDRDGAYPPRVSRGTRQDGSRDRCRRRADDSMKMFPMGVESGKSVEAQPEWFYKGDRSSLVAPGVPLPSPDFALDAGVEAEAGIYLIAEDGAPVRLGFALADEFSEHVTERGNYPWLAHSHSQQRPAALGSELLLGNLPDHV